MELGNSLHFAAMVGFSEICSFLIFKGVNVESKNNDYLTPLHIAAKFGHSKCCYVLKKNGSSSLIVDLKGKTVLHYAAQGGYATCCTILMQLAALYLWISSLKNYRTRKTSTVKHLYIILAVDVKSLECCKALVTQKTDLWISDKQVNSPVRQAYESRLQDIFEFFLQSDGVNNIFQIDKDTNLNETLQKEICTPNR